MRARWAELPTVCGVSTHRTTASVRRQVSDAVWSLVIDGKFCRPKEPDNVEAITCATSMILRQIGVVYEYAVSAAEARATALKARSSAQSYASPAVVGAAGVVVNALCTGGTRHMAGELARCRSVFDDGELFAGTIALLVGFIEQVAALADLDVATVAVQSITTADPRSGVCTRRSTDGVTVRSSLRASFGDADRATCRFGSLISARRSFLPRREHPD